MAVHRNANGMTIHRYRFVPYDEIAKVLKEDGSAFLEQTDDRELKPQTMWKAAKKISKMVGKPVKAYPALYRKENGDQETYFEGYCFQTVEDEK